MLMAVVERPFEYLADREHAEERVGKAVSILISLLEGSSLSRSPVCFGCCKVGLASFPGVGWHLAQPADCPAVYRSRIPRESPVFRLVESGYEKVIGIWDDRFESSYGFWRSFVEDIVFAL
jgi:hypothetical protein